MREISSEIDKSTLHLNFFCNYWTACDKQVSLHISSVIDAAIFLQLICSAPATGLFTNVELVAASVSVRRTCLGVQCLRGAAGADEIGIRPGWYADPGCGRQLKPVAPGWSFGTAGDDANYACHLRDTLGRFREFQGRSEFTLSDRSAVHVLPSTKPFCDHANHHPSQKARPVLAVHVGLISEWRLVQCVL